MQARDHIKPSRAKKCKRKHLAQQAPWISISVGNKIKWMSH